MYNIVGAGLAGSMLAKSFDNHDIEYRIFEAQLPFAASKISENLFSDTWLKDVSYIKDSLDWIHDNYKVEDRCFFTYQNLDEQKKKLKYLYHLPIPEVLKTGCIAEEVLEATKEGVRTAQNFYKGMNIICAGLQAKKLFKLPHLDALTGHGFFMRESKLRLSGVLGGRSGRYENYINTFRPYTHEKIMRWHDGYIWYGDSTAIKHNNYIKKQNYYISESKKRLKKLGITEPDHIVFGARPMNIKNKRGGMLVKINSNNIILNGGWKDGLVIYPYLISQIYKWLKK